MKKRIQIVPSGLPLVDKSWGGFYSGGTYLLIGARKSGKTMLSLQYAMECARQNEICLFFTSMRPKDLMILAASIDFDLQEYMNQNLIIVVRVAPPKDIFKASGNDEFYVEYLRDIVTVVEKYRPSKIVFDELTPFISFNNINLLRQTFLKTIEVIEESGITSLFILGEPATPAARQIVDALSGFSTGLVHLQKDEFSEHGGIIYITPNIGHNEGRFSANYFIEPYKGIVDDYQESQKSPGKNDNFRPLVEFETAEEDFAGMNLYNISDFELILNNQIAMYNSTGQKFSLIAFRIDARPNITVNENQLFNAVRLSIERKEKLCRCENLQIVLLQGDDDSVIKSIISRVKKNLNSGEENSVDVLKSVSVNIVKVDSTVTNAADILRRVMSGETREKSKFGYY